MIESQRRILRIVGYPLLGLVVFIFAMHFTFPYDRLRDLISRELSGSYDVGVAEISPGLFPGRFTVKNVTLTTRPASESEKAKTLQIDKVDLSIGLFALIGKTVSIDFDAKLGEGRLFGNVESSAKGFAVDLETEDVSLETVPGLGVITGGAPIAGPLVAKVKLSVPAGKWSQSNGSVDVNCANCTIGDGVTKVRSPGPQTAFSSEGFTLPKIKLGELVAKIAITNGVVCIVKLEAHSNEGEVTVEGGLKLADQTKDSLAQLYAVLKLSDEFKKQSARNNDLDIVLSTGARMPDGYDHFQAKTTLAALRWTAARTPPPPMRECIGVAQPSAAPRAAAPARPPFAPPPPAPPTATVTTPPPVGAPPPPPPNGGLPQPPPPGTADTPATPPVEPPLPQVQAQPEQPQPAPPPTIPVEGQPPPPQPQPVQPGAEGAPPPPPPADQPGAAPPAPQ
jgi:type II secretion system protein N